MDIQRITRRRAVSSALVVGGGLASGVFALDRLTNVATSAPGQEQDARILNLVLRLERLEFAFYNEAVTRGEIDGEFAEYARTVTEHERSHVALLETALGTGAAPAPSFEFGEATRGNERFGETAVTIENLVIGAYNGQAANLTKPALATAATIVSVDGRHAGWIAAILGRDPAPDATDELAAEQDVISRLDTLGFIR